MGISSGLRLDQFLYDLPIEAIAQTPLYDRSAARLLDTRDLSDHVYSELPELLEEGDLVVVNSTRVRSARLAMRRVDTGGSVEVLLLGPLQDGTWSALVKPARRLRAGIALEQDRATALLVSDPLEGRVRVKLEPPDGRSVEAWIESSGEMPLPPYISASLENPDRYQTMFAETVGSAAAPTAGLHFTTNVVDALEDKGIDIATIDLRVGIDTFRPIKAELLADHQMHSELYDIPQVTADLIASTRRKGGRVVAVGTTVTRTLETAACGDGLVSPGEGASSLFIAPGYRLQVVDLMLTNFHVPGSTLVVMISAMMGDRWRESYAIALERGYRFLSFGDTMLLEPTTPARRH